MRASFTVEGAGRGRKGPRPCLLKASLFPIFSILKQPQEGHTVLVLTVRDLEGLRDFPGNFTVSRNWTPEIKFNSEVYARSARSTHG